MTLRTNYGRFRQFKYQLDRFSDDLKALSNIFILGDPVYVCDVFSVDLKKF